MQSIASIYILFVKLQARKTTCSIDKDALIVNSLVMISSRILHFQQDPLTLSGLELSEPLLFLEWLQKSRISLSATEWHYLKG